MSVTRCAKVLIIDDKRAAADSLVNAFEGFNQGTLKLPDAIPETLPCVFSETEVLSIAEAKEVLDECYDVYVFDRLLPSGALLDGGDVDMSTGFLLPLLDLSAKGLRIVYTAYPDPQNLIQCMRLGAWDYIDKNDHHPVNSVKKVVISVLLGLQAKEMETVRANLNAEGGGYIARNYRNLQAKHKGKFIALTRRGEEDWEMLPGDEATTLFGLYEILGERRMSVHIARFKG